MRRREALKGPINFVLSFCRYILDIVLQNSEAPLFDQGSAFRAAWEIWFNQSEALPRSALVCQTSFGGQVSGTVTKCRLFFQANACMEVAFSTKSCNVSFLPLIRVTKLPFVIWKNLLLSLSYRAFCIKIFKCDRDAYRKIKIKPALGKPMFVWRKLKLSPIKGDHT